MQKETYSKNISNAIKKFLTENDWRFSFDDRSGLFKFGLSLKGQIKSVNYIIDVKDDAFLVYAVSPLGADEGNEKMMAAMAEFVCRVNYGLRNGNFELDMRDGEIRYKSFVDCDGITPTAEMVYNSISCPAAMFNRYGAGIVDIIFDNSTAKDAIDKCEGAPAKELRSLLEEEFDGAGDVDAMIARLASRFGIDESEFRADEKRVESSDDTITVRTNLFGTEGGAE